jgi:hypothetical protein
MAYLVDTWDWTTLEVDLRAHVGVAVGEDARLKGLLLSALRAGDAHMWNPWTDDNTETGVDETPPDDVLLGVFEWVSLRYWSMVTGGDGAPAGMVLTSRRTGDLAETYSAASGSGASDRPSPSELWDPYRLGGALLL